MTEPDSPSYARRFLFIWGALAVLNFVIAGALTATIVRATSHEPPYHPIGMYGDYRDKAVGWIYYYHTEIGSRYLIYYPPHTKFVALPYGTLKGCFQNVPANDLIPAREIATSQWQTHKYYLITMSSEPHGTPVAGEATCRLDLATTRSSFTGFAMDIWFLPSISRHVTAAGKLNFTLNIAGAENMQVFGAQSTSSSGAALEPDDETVIEFTDVRRQGLRDTILIVIGALVGLGAAMALEAIRPYVELAAGRARSRR